jgi:hypothetical protein
MVQLKVEDYYPSRKRFMRRFNEKGGKEKELPVHIKLEELLDQYLKATGLEKEPQSPLFPAAIRRREVSAPVTRAYGRSGHAQATTQTSRYTGSLFAPFIPSDRHHEFSGK